jgi:hypothetical protein
MVVKDAFTLDLALNPDFSQVESDEPQVTINQRYEVFFPEKRPFFMEKASVFNTPEQLFFTRRIVDPQFGARLTGTEGRWSLGVLAADDRAPGKLLAGDDSMSGDRAVDGVFRIEREFGRQSHIGALATSYNFGSSFNQVASLDTRIELGGNWSWLAQASTSETHLRPATTAPSGKAGCISSTPPLTRTAVRASARSWATFRASIYGNGRTTRATAGVPRRASW